MTHRLVLCTTVWTVLFAAPVLHADTFVYVDETGTEQTVEAQLAGSGQGFHALLQADGRMRIVHERAVRSREPAEGPQPLAPAEMVAVLEEQFGADRLSVQVQSPYVVALVRAGPLDRRGETRTKGFLQKTARFMKNVDTVFERFARDTRFPLREPEYPLVTIVFESDDDFNSFADEASGGRGLSSRNVAGFYSGQTNWLAIRLEECRTYQIPLHEGIHQLMHNRVFQRLAPIPKWFDEGIATGFENNGERIDVHPAKINSHYALRAKNRDAGGVSWNDVVANDESFGGDILAAQSYVEAWSLHWMLVTQHTDAYRKYVQELAARGTLEELPAEQRTTRFEQIFGASVDELAADFPRALESGLRRQRVQFPGEPPAGISLTNAQLAEVQMQAVIDGASGQLRVEGTLKNTSPIRPLTYHVAVVSNSGVYSDWVIDGLDVNKSARLDGRIAAKVLPGTIGGPSRTFIVRVQWALPGSEEAQQWLRSPPIPQGFTDRSE